MFYIENSDTLRMDLGNMNGRQRAYEVDTRKTYEEMPLQILNPKVYSSIKMLYIANWEVMVGGH